MTPEEMQDYDDSFLNDEHPLYYENNPDEGEELLYYDEDNEEYDYDTYVNRRTPQNMLNMQEDDNPLYGCMAIIVIILLLYIFL